MVRPRQACRLPRDQPLCIACTGLFCRPLLLHVLQEGVVQIHLDDIRRRDHTRRCGALQAGLLAARQHVGRAELLPGDHRCRDVGAADDQAVRLAWRLLSYRLLAHLWPCRMTCAGLQACIPTRSALLPAPYSRVRRLCGCSTTQGDGRLPLIRPDSLEMRTSHY